MVDGKLKTYHLHTQGPKKATKITHLGINMIVITCFTNEFSLFKEIDNFY